MCKPILGVLSEFSVHNTGNAYENPKLGLMCFDIFWPRAFASRAADLSYTAVVFVVVVLPWTGPDPRTFPTAIMH